ncbi:leucine-rich repeat domain-containing protein [Actinopolymorpha cephalotaxi]|uniref:Leucine-rich repeat domain-containing protein n=2 Tax=Actinopolymorpha cephalotaxi TaxID=504797 RepID=A0ABX2SE28_9ACTN|nr:hypothetical protein [Actinopolymorpha cephalotaxi]NYH86822.1 hypothetical protein [Actinopolymorpha cephalotaxi]
MIRDLVRDKAKALPTDANAAHVTALRVWHCNYWSLAPLEQYPNLRTLVVASYPDSDVQALAALAGLEYLSLLHMPHVRDLAPLEGLRHLRTVRLATSPGWDSSGKVTVVDSLQPLANLPGLKHLELFGIQPASRSLQELESAPELVSLRASKYPAEEPRRFYMATGVTDAIAPSPGVADWS